MTNDLDLIFAFLLDELLNALHMRDSALQVAAELPGWEQKYQAALVNPLLMNHTMEHFAPRKQLLDAFRQGTVDDEQFLKLVSDLRGKDPN